MTTYKHARTAAESGPASMSEVLLDGMTLFDTELGKVGASDWERSTPCTDWKVEALVRHTADTADRVTAALQGRAWEASSSTAPPVKRWQEASASLRSQLAATPVDSRWPIPDDAPHGKFRFHGCDFVIHSWDLSVAIGQEVELPAGWVAYMESFFSALPSEVLRRPRAFHDPVEPAPGDGPTRQLMAFLGRRPL